MNTAKNQTHPRHKRTNKESECCSCPSWCGNDMLSEEKRIEIIQLAQPLYSTTISGEAQPVLISVLVERCSQSWKQEEDDLKRTNMK